MESRRIKSMLGTLFVVGAYVNLWSGQCYCVTIRGNKLECTFIQHQCIA